MTTLSPFTPTDRGADVDLQPASPEAAALCARLRDFGRRYGPEQAARAAGLIDRAPAEHRASARAAWREGCAAHEVRP